MTELGLLSASEIGVRVLILRMETQGSRPISLN